MQSEMQEKLWKWTLKNLITDKEAERAEESRTYVLVEIEEKEANALTEDLVTARSVVIFQIVISVKGWGGNKQGVRKWGQEFSTNFQIILAWEE